MVLGKNVCCWSLFCVCLCGLFFMHFLTVWSEKKRFWLKKILKAFHRSHFLNSLSPFSSLSSVFVGFCEKFKKSKSRQENSHQNSNLSLLHIINNFKTSSSQQKNALIIQRKRGSKTTPQHQNNNNFNFNFNNNNNNSY